MPAKLRLLLFTAEVAEATERIKTPSSALSAASRVDMKLIRDEP
jgi:hypothetical protein